MNGVYLAISMTSNCNLKCFYCKPTGESISGEVGTISYDEFCDIVSAAYHKGIDKFRLTGGECTIVPYFEQAVEFIMNMGADTRINVCSNGCKLKEYIPVLSKYKDRINVRISVDSICEYLNGYHFPKWLSPETIGCTKLLLESGIRTRYNIVITSYNIEQVKELVEKSLKLGVDIKLLDLYVQDIYLGGKGTSQEFWDTTYQSLSQFRKWLENISDKFVENYWDDSAYGIPMNAYFVGDQSIVLKDSSKGAHFSKFCISKCNKYSKCQEGIYVPFVSVGSLLHINGCYNESLRWNLKNKKIEEMENAFSEMLKLFDELVVKTESAANFSGHHTYVGDENE